MKFLASATILAVLFATSDAATPLCGAEQKNKKHNLKNPGKAKGRDQSGKAYGYYWCATNLGEEWDTINEGICEDLSRSDSTNIAQEVIDDTDFCGCEWIDAGDDSECEEIPRDDLLGCPP